MPALDVFNTDAFSMVSLTDAINKIPPLPLKLSRMGLFDESGVATTTVMIEELNGTLTLLPVVARGGPATQNVRDGRVARAIAIPHIPVEDRINADEIENVRAFGSETELQTVQTIVNERQARMARALDMTLEWHRIGAIKGQVLDSDGSTVVVDLFTEFGVSQQAEVDFSFDTAATGDIKTTAASIIRTIRDELGGVPMTGVTAVCGQTFWDDLIAHGEVREAFERWQALASARGASGQPGDFFRMSQVDSMFQFAGVMWVEYSDLMGSETIRAVADTKAHFFPTGVPGLFVTRYAPANFVETVNTLGQPRYMKQAPDGQFQRWVDLHAQSNPLNLCTRPRVLVPAKNT